MDYLINLSNIREAGAPIKGVVGASSGVIPVMKLYEDSFSYSNQLGQRQGAGAVYLSVFHPDIDMFLSTKKENADEKIRVKTLSLGLVVPDKFYELVKSDSYMYLFSPYDVEREYGKPFSYVDITKHYDEMVANKSIRKKRVKARELETEISKLQQESGYPYILNVDTANKSNPVDGKIVMSNLCSEVLQSQELPHVNDLQEYTELGKDISCNLGSTNIVNHMKSGKDFGKSVETMVRALNFVTVKSSINVVPSVKAGNDAMHTIGLGAMGLHHYLATNHMEYGSKESIEFTGLYFQLMNYWTLKASNKLAKELGETFSGFEKSDYANGSYFDNYKEHVKLWEDLSPKAKELFKDITIPTEKDWSDLKESVAKYGLFNAYRMALAPTGSISYVNETTASIHPILQPIEERAEKKSGNTYYPAPELSNDTLPYYKSAYDMDMRKVIDVYAEAQKHIDQGMSLTLFLRTEDIPAGLYPWKPNGGKQTTKDLSLLRMYAWNKGIKTIYYIRSYISRDQEIGSNTCESCTI